MKRQIRYLAVDEFEKDGSIGTYSEHNTLAQAKRSKGWIAIVKQTLEVIESKRRK